MAPRNNRGKQKGEKKKKKKEEKCKLSLILIDRHLLLSYDHLHSLVHPTVLDKYIIDLAICSASCRR